MVDSYRGGWGEHFANGAGIGFGLGLGSGSGCGGGQFPGRNGKINICVYVND